MILVDTAGAIGHGPIMSAVAMLHQSTHSAHETVDAAFARFDLHDEQSYGGFLSAHARAVPVAERIALRVLALRPRAPLLEADLAALGLPMPALLNAPAMDDAAAWGVLYVLEGSRLGGRLLAAQVSPGLPSDYLDAIHLPGEWRDTRQAIDAAAKLHDEAWLDRMMKGALATFDLYRRAAQA